MGFDPQAPALLESFRCVRCLYPAPAAAESRSRGSVCAWCAGERAGPATHWCERGGHTHRLAFANYNPAENMWDCGLCAEPRPSAS